MPRPLETNATKPHAEVSKPPQPVLRWRTIVVCLAMCALLPIAGCARNRPHGIAERYLENLQQFNYMACYQLLSDGDHNDRNLREFLTEIPLAPDISPLWFRPVLHSMHFELGPAHRNSDGLTAVVPVRITMPDLPLWERILDAAAGPEGSGEEAAQRALDTGDYPKWTYDDKFFLVKEHHHWHIVAGFGVRDRVVDRHREAIVDYTDQHFDKAIPEWQSMIADLRSQNATGSLGLAAVYEAELAVIRKNQAQIAERSAYIPKLTLSGVAMKMSEERVPAIFGAITNSGDKGVDEVELAVTWYQGRGKNLKAVHREEHPVVVTPITFTDFTSPVIPFLPGETRRFGFILTAPTPVQQAAAPYVTIASVAFTQSAAPLPKLHAPPSASTMRSPKTPAAKASPKIAARGIAGTPAPTAPPHSATKPPAAAPSAAAHHS